MSSSLKKTVAPTAADIANTFVPFFPATLSILGVSAVLYNILSDPRRRLTTPYFRLMLGLIIADLISSLTSMTSTFLAPQNTPFLFYSVGNQTTCNIQGFFIHVCVIQPLYTASLSVYYLLVIKYNVSDIDIAKKYEMWMHIFSISYPIVGSIVSLIKGLFNPTPWGCRIAEYPPKCNLIDEGLCLRGAAAKLYVWLLTGIALNICLGIIIACMGSIIFFVKKRERIMNRRLSFSNNTVFQSKHLIKQSREVMIQGLFYVGSFILAWIFSSAYTLSRIKPVFLVILSQFFWPLQGFFSSLIYFWPRYNKSRDEFKDKSFLWLVKDMIVTTTREKEQRRVVFQSIRRRQSIAAPTTSTALRGDDVKDKDDSALSSGNFISSDIATSVAPLGSYDVTDESSNSLPTDIDGDPVVTLQRLRGRWENESSTLPTEA